MRGPHSKPSLLAGSAADADKAVAARLQFNVAHTESILGVAPLTAAPVRVDESVAMAANP